MQDYKNSFIRFVIENQILRFGEFTLKSGRVSPYFFNAGLFNTGAKLAFLARCYAATIVQAGLEFDLLFGPAYKGIPLASVTAATLATEHGVDRGYCFNRKEAKAHGEGGLTVGAALAGRVLLIDDVITAGTAINEAVGIVRSAGASLAGIIVAMDRQEKGKGEISTMQELAAELGVPVVSIIALSDIVSYLDRQADSEFRAHLDNIAAYRARYGAG